MRVPLSWLRDYVSIDVPTTELAERLSISTAEVNGIHRTGVPDSDGNLGLFRVGKVLEAGKHPNADRLQLCQVDVGEGEPRQIVCGAWNFAAGATVAVALPGAVLPGGQRLERAKLRGSVSDGMILSERELELSQEHSGILVLEAGEPGELLADVLPLGDDVLDVEATPNRVDLLSVYGLAREVAALYRLELGPPPGRDPEPMPEQLVPIEIEDVEGCPRYIGRTFSGVSIGASPPWLKARLTAAGMRPISNVVDITNYVMLALGNPLHAFDATKLVGGRIVVRRARAGEQIQTLDGQFRKLDPADLMIADADRSVAIAGIMGGEETEVTEETTEVLLEAANFEPYGLLATSERLRLRTEGSNRWEKGVDPHLAVQAAALATELLLELADARWTGQTDMQADFPERPLVEYRPARADTLIGLETAQADQRELLERFGFDVEGDDGGDWHVRVPTWRARDVRREVDVVEEIARVRLEDVPFTLPVRREMYGRFTRDQRLRRRVEDALAGIGFAEAYTPSLVPVDAAPEGLGLPEPLSSEQAVLRTSLLPGLVEAARRNGDSGNERIALFEIARVYEPAGIELPRESAHVGVIVDGGYAAAKGAVEALYRVLKAEPQFEATAEPFLHPARAARIGAGWVGELHPSLLDGTWGAFELDLAALFDSSDDPVAYEDVITYPALRQDLAFVVDERVPAAELFTAAREAAGPELRDVRFLSDYREPPIPTGKKSIAFSVAFQSPERTLTDDDAGAIRARIVEALKTRFQAELRA